MSDNYVLPAGSLTSVAAAVDAALRQDLKDQDAVLDTLCGPMGRLVPWAESIPHTFTVEGVPLTPRKIPLDMDAYRRCLAKANEPDPKLPRVSSFWN